MSSAQDLDKLMGVDSVVHLDSLEISRQIELRPRKALSLFKKVANNQRGFVLLHLPAKLQQNILKNLAEPEIIKFLHYLDLEAASQIIPNIDKKRRDSVAEELGKDIKEKLKSLAGLDPERVENLMDLNYVEINSHMKVSSVIGIVKKYEKKTGRFPTILIVKEGFFIGSLPGHALSLLDEEEGYEKYVKSLPTVYYAEGYEKIVKVFEKAESDKVVVLNEDNSILGIIYSEEMMNLITQETAKKLYAFAGLDQSEDIEDSFKKKVKFRHRWLILNLFTAFLAAGVVALHEETISKMVLLAAYMPVVAGMGGNAATQTLAVVVRGLATKNIGGKGLWRIVGNEMLAGFLNGMITALIICVIALVMNQGWQLGVVAGLAVVNNLLIAGFFGTVVPVIMHKLGKDPATSATIFITTATDVFGFMAFLGLANLFF